MSDEQPDLSKVIARIQKCFARTGVDGREKASEAEADTAMKIAQELMLKYNLDMATIEAATNRSSEDTSQQRVKEALAGKTRFKWQRDLAQYVAEANFCYYLLKDDSVYDEEAGKYRTKRSHVFVGRKSNVVTAQMMYAYLTQTIEDNAPEDDARLADRAGEILYSPYKGTEYRVKVLENGLFERLDGYEPYAKGVPYRTLSAAAKFIREGKETNGLVFFGLGAASTAVSWKEGCADRICERLAAKRADLIAQNDARVRAEEAAQRAESERRAAEAKVQAERVLNAREATTQESIDAMLDDAYAAPHAAHGEASERPTEDDTDWTPGEGAEEEPIVDAPPQAATAMVLASVYDAAEREANKEMAEGLAPGTYAKWRAEAEERRIAREKRDAERVAQRIEVPEEEWTPGATVSETPTQAARRQRREAEEYAKQRRRWARMDAKEARQAEREYAKKDHSAYRAGQVAGERVGLDPQVKAQREQRKLEG